jgi:hypothetical protein
LGAATSFQLAPRRRAISVSADRAACPGPRTGADKPPKYPTTYYTYMIRYQQRTYNVFGRDDKDAAE